MTVQFQIRGMRDDQELRRQMETDLGELRGLVEVTAAHVALHFQWEVTPAYQAVAMLAVSGPDIHAAARDHTWPAAWQKVVARLREQMEERRRRKKARRQGEPQVHSPPGNRGKHEARVRDGLCAFRNEFEKNKHEHVNDSDQASETPRLGRGSRSTLPTRLRPLV